MTARANENHVLGCDLVRTGRQGFDSLVLDDILLEEMTAAQRLIWKILYCRKVRINHHNQRHVRLG